jgi:hypothetical protein
MKCLFFCTEIPIVHFLFFVKAKAGKFAARYYMLNKQKTDRWKPNISLLNGIDEKL